MRYLSAYSSGTTGVSLANALAEETEVTLFGSPEAALRAEAAGLPRIAVYGSTRDLLSRMEAWCQAHPYGAVIHAAAVGDYEAEAEEGKVESGRTDWTLNLRPTPKIANEIRGWMPDGFIVTFKAAAPQTRSEALTEIAQAQLERTRSNLVFANVIGALQESVQIVEALAAESFTDRQRALETLVRRVLDA
jgi:phosphopantothenoylcysteine decarboxylase/phosphopantothenate--cysteine ligase